MDNRPQKQRKGYIDIAKGILIILLVIHHAEVIYHDNLHVNNQVLSFLEIIQFPLITCYFLQLFFLITGYCSNFKKQFKPFLINQSKTLLLPLVTITLVFYILNTDRSIISLSFYKGMIGCLGSSMIYGSFSWFLVTMFEAKIIYYVINRYVSNKRMKLGVLLLLSLLGSLIYYNGIHPELRMHRQVLEFLLFLGIGNIFKERLIDKKYFIISIIAYSLIAILYFTINKPLPFATSEIVYNSIFEWPLHILLSMAGSIIILYFSYLIKREKLLEYIGKNSLVIYLIHANVMLDVAPLLVDSMNSTHPHSGNGLNSDCFFYN